MSFVACLETELIKFPCRVIFGFTEEDEHKPKLVSAYLDGIQLSASCTLARSDIIPLYEIYIS